MSFMYSRDLIRYHYFHVFYTICIDVQYNSTCLAILMNNAPCASQIKDIIWHPVRNADQLDFRRWDFRSVYIYMFLQKCTDLRDDSNGTNPGIWKQIKNY